MCRMSNYAAGVRYVAVPVVILALRLRASDGSWLMLSEEVIGYLLMEGNRVSFRHLLWIPFFDQSLGFRGATIVFLPQRILCIPQSTNTAHHLQHTHLLLLAICAAQVVCDG